MTRRAGDRLAVDEPEDLVDHGMRLVAEHRKGEFGHRAQRLGIAWPPHLFTAQRASVSFCAALFGSSVSDLARLAPGLDLRLLARRVALARCGHYSRSDLEHFPR